MVEIAYPMKVGRVPRKPVSLTGPIGQRTVDLGLALVLLFICLPIMLLVAAAIYIEDGGPIFYVQPRVGRWGKVFDCLKFRSMGRNADARLYDVLLTDPVARAQWTNNRKLARDPRVTRVGRVIRRQSLDELPQLLNVLKGQMSVVGPRPIMIEEQKLYGRRLAAYVKVRPGITGLWQVSGRGDASFRSRIAMDMVYLRSRRLRSDLKILARTVPAVLSSRGSY